MSHHRAHKLLTEFRPPWLVGCSLVILLVGVALRFTRSDFQSLWYDEVFSVVAAQAPNFDELLAVVGRDFHPPLYFVLLRGWFALWGQSDLSARLLSGVIGALSLAMVGVCARDVLGRSYVPIALLLAGTSLTLIWFSQEVRQYELLFLVGAVCFHSVWRLIRAEKALPSVVVYVAVSHAAALYVHYASALIFISEWMAVLLLVPRRPSGVRRSLFRGTVAARLFVAHTGTFILFSPWIPRFMAQREVARGGLWIPTPTLSTVLELIPRLFAYRLPWDTGRFPYLYLALWMPVIGVALWFFGRKGKEGSDQEPGSDGLTLIAVWCIVPIVASYLISLGDTKILFFRNLLFMLPGLILLLSLGSVHYRSVMLPTAFIIATSLANLPWYYTSRHKEDWRRASPYILERLNPSSAMIFDAPGTWLSFDYYTKHAPFRDFSSDSAGSWEQVLYVRSLSGTPLADISTRLGAHGFKLANRKNFPGIIVLTFKRGK
jgi:uncharacterized membrane protein